MSLKHGRTHLLLVLGMFVALSLVLFRFSLYAMALQTFAQIAAIFAPLVAIYYFSRRFEYAADAFAVDFTGEPEAAIRALVNLHKIHEVPAQSDRFSELFMTHPPLTRRTAAIAKVGHVPADRLDRILGKAYPRSPLGEGRGMLMPTLSESEITWVIRQVAEYIEQGGSTARVRIDVS